jgi:TRAP-type C4-dicarboxylate transport system substrate-binding protein
MRKIIYVIVVAVLTVGLMVGCTGPRTSPSPSPSPTSEPVPEAIKWRMQIYQPGGFHYEAIQEYICDEILKASNGRLEIELFPGGSLYPHVESYDYCGQGLVEMFQGSGNWASGTIKELNFEPSLPGDPRSAAQIDEFFYDRGYIDRLREIYANEFNLYYVGYQMFLPYQIISKVPIESLDDLNGRKIRACALLQTTFGNLGALPTCSSPDELYTQLAQGVLDAAAWGSASETTDLALEEQAKYWIEPGVTGPMAAAIMVNLDAWNALPEDLQEIVHLAVVRFKDHYWRILVGQEASAVQTMKEAGVTVIQLPDSEIVKLIEYADEAMYGYAGDDPGSLEFIDMYHSHLRDLGYID